MRFFILNTSCFQPYASLTLCFFSEISCKFDIHLYFLLFPSFPFVLSDQALSCLDKHTVFFVLFIV